MMLEERKSNSWQRPYRHSSISLWVLPHPHHEESIRSHWPFTYF